MTQMQRRFSCAIMLACTFIAFAGPAKAESVKCTGKNGAVLLTDVPCNAVATRQPPLNAKALALERKRAEADRTRINAEKNRQPASRRFSLDVATSAAARDSLTSIDEA